MKRATRSNPNKRQTRTSGVFINENLVLRPNKRAARRSTDVENTVETDIPKERQENQDAPSVLYESSNNVGTSRPGTNQIILNTPEFVGQELTKGTEINNEQSENGSSCEQLSALTSITGRSFERSKGDSIPTVLNRFSNEVVHNWKSHEESLRKVLKMRVSTEYFPKYKFCNMKICRHVVLKCLERNEINRTKGMTLQEFLDVTSRAIVFQLFNDGRHVIQSNMRREYRSKYQRK